MDRLEAQREALSPRNEQKADRRLERNDADPLQWEDNPQLFAHVLETIKNLRTSSICLSLPFGGERYRVDPGKLTEVFLEGIADGLDRWKHTPDEDWIKTLRLFFAGGENHVSEILLGVQAAESLLRDRLTIRVLIPSEEPGPA
jgi:hypothetical protein